MAKEQYFTSSKPFDDTFKTLSEKNSKLLIPVINECFNQNYSMNDEIELLSGEHHIMLNAENSDTKEIITDTSLKIANMLYHIECQSTPDGTMVLRMVEYDFFIALEHATKGKDGTYEMHFPKSVILYLRHTGETPDTQKIKVFFDDEKSIEYEVPIVKTQLYSADDIIDKKLYFLIPYYILKYENMKDASYFDEIEKEYGKLYRAMDKAYSEGIITMYDITNIQEFIDKLITHTAKGNKYIEREAERIMGGTVLETKADKWLNESKIEGKILAYSECGLSDEEISIRVGKDIEYVRHVIQASSTVI